MPFDGFVTSSIAQELNSTLAGGRIEKIHQPTKDELVITINNNRKKHRLLITSNSNNPRLYLTEEKIDNPETPTGFCMLLRKHLSSGTVSNINQVESERIIEIHITGSNELGVSEKKNLIFEIMGKHSNIILVDEESKKILDSIKRISGDVNRYRQLLPGKEYIQPDSQGKISFFDISPEKLTELIKNSDSEGKTLLRNIQGISPLIAEEIIKSGNPEKRFYDFVDEAKNDKFSPAIYFDGEKPLDFYVLNLNVYRGLTRENLSSVSEMIYSFYNKRESSNRIRQKSTDLRKTLKTSLDKLYLKTQRLSEDLVKAGQAEKYKEYGELIKANIYQLEKGLSSAVLHDYVKDEDVTIKMDPLLDPIENAQKYFKKYNKAKTAAVTKQKQLEETRDKINHLETYMVYIDNAETSEDIDTLRDEMSGLGYVKKRIQSKNRNTKKNRDKFIELETTSGRKVFVGRNNMENDELTMKRANGNDIWFHTKDIPGSHVILLAGNDAPLDDDIYEAASIAAFYSKGRQSSNVPVDYTLVKYVKKPSGAKPGMVIFTDNHTVYVDPKKPSL